MTTPIVETEFLNKVYDTTVAVRDIDLVVERGSITGVVGPNGAGKTTTFLMLATLLEPTAGRVTVCGADPVTDPREVRSRMGYMPDFFGIYDDLRVSEYLEFFAAAYGIRPPRRARLVDDLLELVDLAGKRDAFVEALSRGMKQRLCLARALVHDPELLILDEPASGLDPRARIELRSLLLELQRSGKTILISSHILAELEEICSHVAMFEAGAIVAQGPTGEVAAAFAGARRFRIRAPLEDRERLLALLGEVPEAEEAQQLADGDVLVTIEGGEDEATAVLRAVVNDGIRVTGYFEVSAGLEEIFMRVTRGIVS